MGLGCLGDKAGKRKDTEPSVLWAGRSPAPFLRPVLWVRAAITHCIAVFCGEEFLKSSAPSAWEKMVNVLKGVLIECDPAMKQFLLYLDEANALGKKFIIQDIDDTHVFVIAELVNVLQERVGELMDQNAFSLTQK